MTHTVTTHQVDAMLRERGSNDLIISRWRDAISTGSFDNPKPLLAGANEFSRTYNLGIRFLDVDEVNGEYEFTVENNLKSI